MIFRIALLVTLAVVSLSAPAFAQTNNLKLLWDPVPEQDIDYYNVYIGGSAGAHDVMRQPVPASQSSYVFAALPGVLYYFAVSAVNTAGTEGPLSAEIIGSVPLLYQPDNRTSTVGVPIVPLYLYAEDPDGGTLRFTHTGLPFGLSLDQSSGVVTGIPTSIGSFNVTIFVTDGVVTTSKSFVWTIQAPGTGDMTAPSLSITSHASGDWVGSPNITVSGTATDSGSGNSGISSVTVNGLQAAGGTASGGGTANWSRSITLSGANTVLVEARDGAGNYTAQLITLAIDGGSSGPAVALPAVITADSVSPSSGTGASQTFALKYSSSLGATNLQTAWVWVTDTFSTNSTYSCLLHYDRTSGQLYMLDDGSTWMPGTLGTSGTLQNSQCVVSLGGSSVTLSGNTLTLNLAMTFMATYAGTKNIYMYAASTDSTYSGWQQRGDWTVPGWSASVTTSAAAVTVDSVTPDSGSSDRQTFALKYSSTLGATDLASTWVWFNETFSSTSTNSCLLYYDQSTAALYLQGDSGTWMQGWIGYAGTLQNTQCAVTLGASWVTLSGNTLTLHLTMTFTSAYAGTKNIYMYAANWSDMTSGWQNAGYWTVPGSVGTVGTAAAVVTADSVSPSSGYGSRETFALRYSDSSGATNLSTMWVWFNATFADTATDSCLLYYDQTNSTLYLLSDWGTWMAGTLGDVATLQNSQCAVTLGASWVTTSANTVKLNLTMTFSPAYAGPKYIYMYAQNTSDVIAGWQSLGSWTVP